jgi:hypothetical protein
LNMYSWINRKLEKTTAGHLYPFYMDDNFRLRPVATISELDAHGRIVRRLETALKGLPDDQGQSMDMRVLPDPMTSHI